MLTLLAQAAAAPVVDTAAVAVDTSLAALAIDPMFGLQVSIYVWLLAAAVGFGVAAMMKILYIFIKRNRIAAETENNVKA